MKNLLLALFAVAALAGAASAQPGKQPSLTGQTWQLSKLAGISRENAGLTATFASGKVSGFAGCNTYNGTYTTSGSSIRVNNNLAVTSKACGRLVMAQEKAFLAALTAARTYSISKGALTLQGTKGRTLATFTVQSQTLAGTHWEVTGYNNGKNAVVSPLNGSKLTAVFGPDGHVSGSAGCNDYSGPYKTTPPKIAIGPLAATRKACSTPPGVMDQEQEFLAAMSSAATYSLQGSMLELRNAGGAIAVTLTRG